MSIRSKLLLLREYLTPINHASNFSTTGEISPEEFVLAGDYLAYKFPTWLWGTCPAKLQKSFLPPDKQFLVTRLVPSYQRVATYFGEDKEESAENEEDGYDWIQRRAAPPQVETPDIDDLIEELVEDDVDDDDEFHHINSDNLLRKYDMYITYLTSYRVPKMYLVGFNSSGIPLLPEQMFEDISVDYRDKTATIENLPVSYNTTSVLIHPCKHSSVMKVLMKHSQAANDEAGIRVDQYLVIFLKFIASVTPGINYDYTMDAL